MGAPNSLANLAMGAGTLLGDGCSKATPFGCRDAPRPPARDALLFLVAFIVEIEVDELLCQ
jgi:hypothetical protein